MGADGDLMGEGEEGVLIRWVEGGRPLLGTRRGGVG